MSLSIKAGTITARSEDYQLVRLKTLLHNILHKFGKKPEIIVQTITAAAGKVPEMEVVEALKSIEVVWEELFPIEQARIVKLLIKEVVVTKDGLDIRIFKDGLNTLSQELESV